MPGRYTRHDDHPPLDERPAEIPAECYNCARLALIRSGGAGPVWLNLPGLSDLKLALMPDAWVVADWQKGQMPIIAWSDFCPAADRALHHAVPCGLRTYTGSADRMLDTVALIIHRQLRAHLKDGDGQAEVVPLPDRS
ncbi:hypothetical protein [Thalassovita mangrovi]|uniref:Uncharacterized protein n=1 Tax=Thalassovita mangrovi TaxID=2692236 RepID=A0A6L8LF77_9RHOB|nr:hypothetical protein [Thalassovita mangrovi]MYM54475.1 hypothetical protein [Thalassovita mangrovi]